MDEHEEQNERRRALDRVIRAVVAASEDGRGWASMAEAIRSVRGLPVNEALNEALLEIKSGKLRLTDTGAFYARTQLDLVNVKEKPQSHRRDMDALTLVREARYLQTIWTDMHDKGFLTSNESFMNMEDGLVLLVHQAISAALEEGFQEDEIDG